MSAHRVTGHPAHQSQHCFLCYKRLPAGAGGPHCYACARSCAAKHRGIVAAISKLRGSPCTHCSEPSVGVIAGGNTLCEFHARDYKSMDFIPRMGFVTYSSIPALVTGH